MGSYCAIGSVKGQLLPVPTLKGKLSIPPYTHCSHDEYEGEYTIVPGEEQIVLATANKLLTHDIVVEPSQGVMPPGTTDIQQGDTIKTFSEDHKTVTTVYSNGNQLVKTFSDDMKTITSVLTDSEGKVIATEIKTFSDDGLTISTNVVYGETDAN